VLAASRGRFLRDEKRQGNAANSASVSSRTTLAYPFCEHRVKRNAGMGIGTPSKTLLEIAPFRIGCD
jgi:hypothetical protein